MKDLVRKFIILIFIDHLSCLFNNNNNDENNNNNKNNNNNNNNNNNKNNNNINTKPIKLLTFAIY